MRKKLFAVADVHGYYTELKKALNDSGFDENNEEHIFVSCGDLFDRGEENVQVYEFVKGLKRKILIRGNHEDNLYDILESGKLEEKDVLNGTGLTVTELLGADVLASDGSVDLSPYSEKVEEIKAFLNSMADYYETEKYVFTHGWLPIVFEDERPKIDPEWREASEGGWRYAHLLEWQQLYGAGAMIEGKTLVCGHRPTYLAHVYDSWREPDCSEIFYGNGMIAIDAATERTKRVNVLVVEV